MCDEIILTPIPRDKIEKEHRLFVGNTVLYLLGSPTGGLLNANEVIN